MLMFLIEIAAAGLFGRAIFSHVPKLAAMIWEGTNAKARLIAWWGGWDTAYAVQHEQPDPVSQFDPLTWSETQDRLEREAFMACPSAFWLEPSRWDRPTWPAAPTKADLRYDGSIADLALAYVVLSPDERLKLRLETDPSSWTPRAVPRITSARRFDRFQATADDLELMKQASTWRSN